METPKIRLSPEVASLITGLDDFRKKWKNRRLPAKRLEELRRTAMNASVAASLRMEGVHAGDEAVARLLADPSAAAEKGGNLHEALGYAKALNVIETSWREIPADENHFKSLHAVLESFNKQAGVDGGIYKSRNTRLELFHPGKNKLESFQATPASATPLKMRALYEWFYRELSSGMHHPLVIIAIFIARFLTVQPFPKGNGLLSRLLMNLCLSKNGYAFVQYSSLESEMEKNLAEYQLALGQVLQNPDKASQTFHDWVLFFLRTLDRQKTSLSKKIS